MFTLSLPPFLSLGSCSPRYIRSTLYTVPCTKDILNQCCVPLGLVIQPFASVPLSEVTNDDINGEREREREREREGGIGEVVISVVEESNYLSPEHIIFG